METEPMMRRILLICTLLVLLFVSCGAGGGRKGQQVSVPASVIVPIFNGDSAYRFVDAQVAFGPRVPNTQAHRDCGNWLEEKLRGYGADVVTQNVELTAYNGDRLQARNIVAQFQPEKKKRVLLCAHWDSRPWADSDPDPANHYKPILGANDGGSGVGVLLEVARQLSGVPTTVGVDIMLFDAEDYGVHEKEVSDMEHSWALGSQYWSRMPHKDNYNARFGILLDIVGAPSSKFHREGISEYYASGIIDKVWKCAATLGYADTFVNEEGGYITDDHYYVNHFLGIPCIDIINYAPDSPNGFGMHHHTLKDDMDWISADMLKIVGQTVLTVIYNEK